jgi:hypothetical protein
MHLLEAGGILPKDSKERFLKKVEEVRADPQVWGAR